MLGYIGPNNRAAVERCYRLMRSANHPDKGGQAERFAEVERAWEEAQGELA